jgi:putative nucleotidyltransferase-like protein
MELSFADKFICDIIQGIGETVPDISENEKWNNIYQTALRHHIEPNLYYLFKNKYQDSRIPDSFINNLQQRYYTVATFNTRLYHELNEILKILKKNHIKVTVLKGAYLAAEVYENPSLRPMTDLDLLIKKEDIEKAREILADIDYFPHKQYAQEALNETQIHLPALIKTGKNPNIPDTLVELHWSILRPKINRQIDIEKLWKRTVEFKINDIDTLALSPEDNLHHLAIHTSFDDLFGNGLLALLDIAKLIEFKKDEIKWDELLKITQSAGTERYTFLTLLMTKEILKAEVPNHFLEKLKPEDSLSKIVEFAKERLFRPHEEGSSQADMIGRTLEGSISAKTSSFARKIFPTRAELSEIYGKPPGYLQIWRYYPVRWSDVFKRYISVFFKIICGNSGLRNATEMGSRGRKLAKWLAS